MEMYRAFLLKDKIKFFALVLKFYEEKTTKSGSEPMTIEFESQLLNSML